MTKINRLLLLVSLVWLLNSSRPLQAGDRETAVLERANAVLGELQAKRCNRITLALLRNAQGVAIFPGMFKAAAGIGGRHGRGVLLIREADGSWGPPLFLKLSGASAGYQLGVERTNLVLIFRTRSNLERLNEGKLTLGVEKMGTVGRIGLDEILSTDLCLKTGVFSRSFCKGLFVGFCVEGTRLRVDAAATAAYEQAQQNGLQNGDPMGAGVLPPSFRLQMKLAELSAASPTQNVSAPSRCDPPLSPQP